MQFNSGISAIGMVEPGAHFCHFYKSADDLAETLVPFFKAGLEANESCLWITAEPFGKERAWSALNMAVDNLDARRIGGQIAIYDNAEWYERYSQASRNDVGRMWIVAKEQALAKGFKGLRLTGNTAFLERATWRDFMDYERELRDTFRRQELIALCSYDCGRCDADAVLDVVQAHDFALARRRGTWEVVESASVKDSKEALRTLNGRLEQIVAARTEALSEALAHQSLLTAEVSHRVKNTVASVQALVDQSLAGRSSLDEARQVVRGRLAAFARAHDRLAAVDWRGVRLRDVLAAVLGPYGERVRLELNGEVLTPRAALDLALVFHELVTNAAKYGALRAQAGTVSLQVAPPSPDDPHMAMVWRERGGPPVEQPDAPGFGTRLIQRLVVHDLRGECEMAYERPGLTCTIRAPASEVLVRKAGCVHGALH